MNFDQWFTSLKLEKSAYFAKELKPLFENCWLAAKPIKKQTRSQAQNAYMWSVVYKTIGDDLGYEPEEVHQLMSERFLSYRKDNYKFVKSTTKLNTKEFEEYMEKIRRFASMELHIFISLPNEVIR